MTTQPRALTSLPALQVTACLLWAFLPSQQQFVSLCKTLEKMIFFIAIDKNT